MVFEPVYKLDKRTLKSWREDRLEAFVKDFRIKSIMNSGAGEIARSSLYTLRFLETIGPKPKRRSSDEISGDMNKFWRLFDHGMAFKTIEGIHYIVSMPYGRPGIFLEEYHAMQEQHECMNHVRMYFLSNKYKFRENGDTMLLFSRYEIDNNKVLDKAPDLDEWSEANHPGAWKRYEQDYNESKKWREKNG